MPLAVTTTVLAGLAAIRLEVTGAAAGALVIYRADTNGTAAVRLLPSQVPSGGTLIVTDYEAALAGAVSYSVNDAGGFIVSATTALNISTPRIHLPVLPQYRAELTLITGYRAGRAPEGTTHQVINRVDPVTVLGPLHTRTGTVTVWTATYTDALAVVNALAVGEVAQLRQPTYQGMDMYLTPGEVMQEPASETTTPQRWQVTISFTEVAAPAAGLAGGAGWTFQNIASTYPTFAAFKAAFATFRHALIGP